MVSHFSTVIFVIMLKVSIVVGSLATYGNWSTLIHRVLTIEDPYDSSYMVGNSCVIGTNCVYINPPTESGVNEEILLKKNSLRGSVSDHR